VHPTSPGTAFTGADVEQSIPERFAQQVRRHGERLAVGTGSGRVVLSYDALNRAANRVAWAILARRGAGEEPVALLFEHGASTIVALLGALKAGKLYVPLDPAYPPAETAALLADARASLLVTNARNRSAARQLASPACPLIDIDALDGAPSSEDPDPSLSPQRLAYIVYTSGSTGQPKGVVHTHRNVLHRCMTQTRDLSISPHDRLSLLYSYRVSASVRNVFAALLNGASLHVYGVKEEGLAHLAAWLAREGITILLTVPTVWRRFLQTLTGDESLPRLRVVYLGGEPVYKRDVDLYRRHCSTDCVFVNSMGLTESPSLVRYFVDKDSVIVSPNVPVGHAVDGAEVLLLDEAGREVGIDRIGEIAFKSRYLSPGYWRQPARTREVFLPAPEGGEARWYRTGDLGQRLPDGSLVHLGRKDFQVKVRGHRIEVAEIELTLLDFPGCAEAVVLTAPDRTGEPQLVAYVVVSAEQPSIRILRSFLRDRLPDHMVPSAFVFLDTLPLLPNGKVHRQALPAPDRIRPTLDSPYVAPRTPIEERLSAIWAEALDLDRVGIDDAFLELGGHSLLAGQIIALVVRAFGVDLPARLFLEASTVAQMAVVVTQHLAEAMAPDDLERLLARFEGTGEEQAR